MNVEQLTNGSRTRFKKKTILKNVVPDLLPLPREEQNELLDIYVYLKKEGKDNSMRAAESRSHINRDLI